MRAPQALDDTLARNGNGVVGGGMVTQPGEVLGALRQCQRFPEAQRQGPVEVLEDARGRRGETGIVHMVR
jgi:hypothetical protein